MKTIITSTATALALIMGMSDADATLAKAESSSTSTSTAAAVAALHAAFKNSLKQQQGQGQLQGQQQAVNNSDTLKVEAQKQPAAIGLSAPSFGAAVSDGVINGCAGTESYSVNVGGAFFTPTGNPFTFGAGGGQQTLATLNLCEVRAVAWELSGRMEGEAAEKIYHGVMCQHPTYFSAVIATGGTCPQIAPYKMEVVVSGGQIVPAASPSRPVAATSRPKGTGSQHPDFAGLQ